LGKRGGGANGTKCSLVSNEVVGGQNQHDGFQGPCVLTDVQHAAAAIAIDVLRQMVSE
jgi:hypothetical protein